MWDEIDVLLTSNPILLLQHPPGKLLIKYETEYNKNIETLYKITEIKQLEKLVNQVVLC